MTRPCVFLDRDGVINEKAAEGDYIRRWEDFRVIPGILDWVRLFKALGYLVIVVTNQRGVARGIVSPRELDRIHRLMLEQFAAAGARIDDVFCCPHHTDSCNCRKPEPGMIEAAQRKWQIDLGRSLMIGDSESDLLLARACGLTFVEVRDGRVVRVLDRGERGAGGSTLDQATLEGALRKVQVPE